MSVLASCIFRKTSLPKKQTRHAHGKVCPIVGCTQSGRQIEAKDERVEHELFDDGDAWRESDMGDGGVASDCKSDPT